MENANFINFNLYGIDLTDAKLACADLTGVNLEYAALEGADLTNTILDGVNIRWCTGNGKEIENIETDVYPIVICHPTQEMAIGDVQHSIDKWMDFTDDTIKGMFTGETIKRKNTYFGEPINENIIDFWKEWKTKIMMYLGEPTYLKDTEFTDLKNNIIEWANDKELLYSENPYKQLIKFFEESGELSRALLKEDTKEIQDSIGDILVTLIILSEQLGYDITECLKIAWDEIKNRKGETKNGTFIKELK